MKTSEEWAQFYAKQGLAVVPIIPGEKRPPLKDWQNKATTDPATITAWYKKWPDYGVGFVTGAASGGVVVIDCDQHPERGIKGIDLLEEWQLENGFFPETWEAVSGSGGKHLFFKAEDNPKRQQHLFDNQVDFQADGALIVLPPTIHPKTGKPYRWQRSPKEAPLAKLQGNPWEFIADGFLESHAGAGGVQFTAPEEIVQGNRTDILIRLLGSLQSKGLSDDAIKAAVVAENEAKCMPPLTDEELATMIFPALKRWEKGTYSEQPANKPAPRKLSLKLTSLDNVTEESPDWLITDYIPRYQITSLAGDGGSGKTTIWCSIAAAVSSGKRSFMEYDLEAKRKPERVMFFSAEDSLKYTLARKLRKSGANMANIISLDISDPRFAAIKFNSPFFEQLLNEYRPALCIFDPIQSFVPPEIHMGDRNAMRQCLEPLIGYGEKYGTTFLIVEHANKMAGAYGRKRIADSADIWDISRSVLMAGETGAEDGGRYLSHEKSNYGPLQDTFLYSLDGEKVAVTGHTYKRDRDFVLGAAYGAKNKPQRENARELILDALKEGEMPTKELDELIIETCGISKSTLGRAKQDLKKEGLIQHRSEGNAEKKWFTSLVKK